MPLGEGLSPRWLLVDGDFLVELFIFGHQAGVVRGEFDLAGLAPCGDKAKLHFGQNPATFFHE